jgi:hypothetical protein
VIPRAADEPDPLEAIMGDRPISRRAMARAAGLTFLGLGAARADEPAPELRPDLNGSRLRAPGQATVYLIDRGFRRAVPDVATYEALFRNWDWIIDDIDPETIRLGDPLGQGTSLIRLPGKPAVYFVDGSTRRRVAGPQVMENIGSSGAASRRSTRPRWPAGPRGRRSAEATRSATDIRSQSQGLRLPSRA